MGMTEETEIWSLFVSTSQTREGDVSGGAFRKKWHIGKGISVRYLAEEQKGRLLSLAGATP